MNANFKNGFSKENIKVSRERKDSNMADALCEKTEIFVTTVNDCGKTDHCEFLSSDSIHLDISIKTETTKLDGVCVVDHLQQLHANYELSHNHNRSNSATLKQNLPYVILPTCNSNDSKSSVLPVNKSEKDFNDCQDVSDSVPKELASNRMGTYVQLPTHKDENECQFKLDPASEEISPTSSGMDVQTPKQDLSNLIKNLTSCCSHDTKSLISPVTEECNGFKESSVESFSSNNRNLKKLQVQIERLPRELVDKLLAKYNESVWNTKLLRNEELPNETEQKYDYKLEQLQIKPSYVLLKRLSINDTDFVCQKESKSEDNNYHSSDDDDIPLESLHRSKNFDNIECASNEGLASTDISTSQIEQVPETFSLDSSNHDSVNIISTANNSSLLNKDNVTKRCQNQLQEKSDCSLKLPLPSVSSDTIQNNNKLKHVKQNRRIKRKRDTPISTLLNNKVLSRRIYNKMAKLPKTSLAYTSYKINKKSHINKEPRKHKYKSRIILANKVNKKNLQQQRHELNKCSTNQSKNKSKSHIADGLSTKQCQTVNKKSIDFKKSNDRRKPNARNKKKKTKEELNMQLPKEEECKTEKSSLISRKRKPLHTDLQGNTHQNKCISSNDKENNQSAIRSKKLSLQNHHLEQQISADHGSITELRENKHQSEVPIQLNNSLEKTTFSENKNIEPTHLKPEVKKNTLMVQTIKQCIVPLGNIRTIKPKCQKVFDSCLIIDHHYERKSQNDVTQKNLKEYKQSHKRRKNDFQPQTLAALALQAFFGRRL